MIDRLPRSSSHSPESTGSPNSGEPVFLAVGKLRRAHGIFGEILMTVLTDFPERLSKGQTVFVGRNHDPQVIVGVRWQQKDMLLKIEGIESPEQVAPLRNQIVYSTVDSLPKLAEGEYYHHDMLGLKVVDVHGKALGELTEILTTGANDVYIVSDEDGKETLLPAIPQVIKEVRLEKKEMIVQPPEWE